jgi:hypothetical protein
LSRSALYGWLIFLEACLVSVLASETIVVSTLATEGVKLSSGDEETLSMGEPEVGSRLGIFPLKGGLLQENSSSFELEWSSSPELKLTAKELSELLGVPLT